MRVLVTGHAGYIGSVLAPFLQAAGHKVVGLDTGLFGDDCLFGEPAPWIASIHKDVRDVTAAHLQGFVAVVHLAALCNDPLGDLNAQWTSDINRTASVRLAKLAKEAGVQRFLYASSCSLYGAAGDAVLTEDAPLRPLTPYADSKVQSEEEIAELADPDFSPVFLRNATAYGVSPKLRADVVLNNLVAYAYTTGKVRILSDGAPWRPIVHVEDIARAFAAALTAPREAIHNQAFNVGVQGENYQVRALAEIVRETVLGCEVEYAGQSGPDPRNYRVDFRKIAAALPDFRPQWNAQRGAQELYDAYYKHGLTAEAFQSRKYVRLAQIKHLLGEGYLDNSLRWRAEEEIAA